MSWVGYPGQPPRPLVADLAPLFARRGELLRELASLEDQLGAALGEALRLDQTPDEGLGLAEAARLMGERPETFRRRLDYRKALLRRPGERRLRYSRSRAGADPWRPARGSGSRLLKRQGGGSCATTVNILPGRDQ